LSDIYIVSSSHFEDFIHTREIKEKIQKEELYIQGLKRKVAEHEELLSSLYKRYSDRMEELRGNVKAL
jgi:hypothetical protein